MSNQTLIERAWTAAAVAVNHELLTALADALEAAEAERDALAEVFEDSYPMAYTEWIEVRNAWKRRAERAEALVSTLGEALERNEEQWAKARTNGVSVPMFLHDVNDKALEAFRAFTERAPAPVIRERETR